MGAKKLGLEEVPTIQLSHLSEAQKKAYILADNRIAENSDWNDELLSLELEELQEMDFSIDLTGFDKSDFIVPDFEPVGEDEQGKLDELEPKWIDCPHCGKEFDLREQS